MELVYLEWEDASSSDDHTGWHDRATASPPVVRIFKQVGFVVDCDLDAVILTEAYDDDCMGPRTRIPLGMVRRWVDLDEHIKAPQ